LSALLHPCRVVGERGAVRCNTDTTDQRPKIEENAEKKTMCMLGKINEKLVKYSDGGM